MGELIIECPRNGNHKYLINTQVDDHVIDKTCSDILKHYHPESVINFIELY